MLLISSAVPSFAMVSNLTNENETIAEQTEFISEMEASLEEAGTTVESEISSLIINYEGVLASLTDPSEIEKVQALIDSATELLESYTLYQEKTHDQVLDSPKSKRTLQRAASIHDVAIAAIVSYFTLANYPMSTEFLLHAQANNVTDSTYTPTMGNIYASSVTTDVKNQANRGIQYGNAEYPKSASAAAQKDLYFAIHGFSWERIYGNLVLIKDRYDFAPGDPYDGLAQTAVNAMFIAQQAGALTPFQVRIQA